MYEQDKNNNITERDTLKEYKYLFLSVENIKIKIIAKRIIYCRLSLPL